MNILNVPAPDFMAEEEIILFSDSVGKWIDEHAPPEKMAEWIANSSVPRELWTEAGRGGPAGPVHARGMTAAWAATTAMRWC